MTRMTFSQCERRAQDEDAHDSATFDVVGPSGRKAARWLDAYMGLLILDGTDGFIRGRDLEGMGFWCENFKVPA